MLETTEMHCHVSLQGNGARLSWVSQVSGSVSYAPSTPRTNHFTVVWEPAYTQEQSKRDSTERPVPDRVCRIRYLAKPG